MTNSKEKTLNKKTEQELLLDSEIIKTMAEGVYLVRISDAVIVYTNPKFEKMFGYASGEMIGKHVSIVNAPTDKKPEETAREIMGIIGKTGEWHGEVNNIKKDGTPFWCYANVSVIEHPEYGKVLVAVHSDITEHKEIERKLAEREQLLKEAQEVAGLGIYKMDFTKNRWESSEVLDEILGIDKNFVRSLEGWVSLIQFDDRKMMTDYLQNEVIGKHVNFDKEYRIIQKNSGKKLWVHGFGKMVFDKQNHPLTLVGTIQDITERKEVEEGLSLQVKALQASADAIVITDTRGIIQQINNAFTLLTGYETKEAIGNNMSIIKSGKQDDSYYKNFWKDILAGKIIRKEIVNRRKDGSLYDEEETVTPVKDVNGQITHFISIKRDITDRKRSEVYQNRLAAMVEATSDFASVADTEGNLLYLNTAGRKMVGLDDKTDILKLRIADMHPAWATKMVLEKGLPVAHKEGIWKGDTALLHRDGHEIPVSQVIIVHKNKQGDADILATIMRDISERKKNEEVLRESEHRLSLNVQNMPVGMIEWDKDFQVTSWNPAAEKIFGYTKDEAIGKHANFIIPEEVRPHVDEIWEQLISGKINQSTNENITRDGKSIICEWHNAPLTTTDGKVFGVVSMMLDVTERKDIEEKLVENEQLLKDAQAVTGLGVYKTDFIKNKWESSDILDKIFGIDEDYVRSVDGWASLIHPDDRKMITDYLQNEVFAKKHDFDKEYRIIQKNNGSQRWVHGLGKMTFDKKNRPLAMIGTIQDITERKKIEERLAKSESQYRILAEASHDQIFIIDHKYYIKYLNNTALQQIGRKAEEVIGKPLSDIFPPQTLSKTKEELQKVFKTKKPSYSEQKLNMGGHDIWLSTWLTPLREGTREIDAVMGVARDITERKEVEDTLKQNEERYKTLIDIAPLCIKWFDAKGNLVSVNQHGREEHFLVGKSDEEIKNWVYMDCIDEKYRDLVKGSMQKALEGKSSEFDMEHVPGTSTGHWCHSYLVPAVDEKGKITYILFISRDFTAEKVVEEEKNKNLEMLEKFKDLTVGRELRMIELKKKIEELTGKKDSTKE